MGGALWQRGADLVGPSDLKNISQVREGGNSRDTSGNKFLEISLSFVKLELLLKHNSSSSHTPAEPLIAPEQSETLLVPPLVLSHCSDSSHPPSSPRFFCDGPFISSPILPEQTVQIPERKTTLALDGQLLQAGSTINSPSH